MQPPGTKVPGGLFLENRVAFCAFLRYTTKNGKR